MQSADAVRIARFEGCNGCEPAIDTLVVDAVRLDSVSWMIFRDSGPCNVHKQGCLSRKDPLVELRSYKRCSAERSAETRLTQHKISGSLQYIRLAILWSSSPHSSLTQPLPSSQPGFCLPLPHLQT